ncbi:MAG: (d)CMP kinase [Desulfobacterales bacterium]|nr:(d)CMP kinase [Desulfobacterales bacterium]
MKPLLITIDGPAGAGKTTISRALADALGYRYIDTGALYRAVALHALEAEIASDDDTGLAVLCAQLELRFERHADRVCLMANGHDISGQIRTPEVTMKASAVSARPVVRQFLLKAQKDLGREKSAVFEGRDMGTVVFPDADVKFFLDASVETRAQRRFAELPEDAGQTLDEVTRDMQKRDQDDSSRELAPLKPALDALRVDSTRLSIAAVLDTMMARIRKVS